MRHPGIVHQDVDIAHQFRGLVDHMRDAFAIAYIHALAQPAIFLGHGAGGLFVDIGIHDLRALLRKPVRDACAKARRLRLLQWRFCPQVSCLSPP